MLNEGKPGSTPNSSSILMLFLLLTLFQRIAIFYLCIYKARTLSWSGARLRTVVCFDDGFVSRLLDSSFQKAKKRCRSAYGSPSLVRLIEKVILLCISTSRKCYLTIHRHCCDDGLTTPFPSTPLGVVPCRLC